MVLSTIGKILVVIGVLVIVFGVIAVANPSVVNKTLSLEHRDVIASGTYVIEPMHLKSWSFRVPDDARNAYVALNVQVLEGRDVIVTVTCGSTLLNEKTTGLMHDVYVNPGCRGSIVLSNMNSLITTKKVNIEAVLHYSTTETSTQEAQSIGGLIAGAGIIISIIGGVLWWLRAKRTPTPPTT